MNNIAGMAEGIANSGIQLGDWEDFVNLLNTPGFEWIKVAFFAVLGLVVMVWLVKGILVGGLARSKGYSFFGNFLLGLLFGLFALIFEAGRPLSNEKTGERQDRLALQTAKELYKLQRAREKSQTTSIPKVSAR